MPRIIQNTGLTVFEGGRQVISPAQLGISDADTQASLKFSIMPATMITTSLRHGKLTKMHWKWEDIVDSKLWVGLMEMNGLLACLKGKGQFCLITTCLFYEHDGSDSNFDFRA